MTNLLVMTKLLVVFTVVKKITIINNKQLDIYIIYIIYTHVIIIRNLISKQ